jgi:hypothetical protein
MPMTSTERSRKRRAKIRQKRAVIERAKRLIGEQAVETHEKNTAETLNAPPPNLVPMPSSFGVLVSVAGGHGTVTAQTASELILNEILVELRLLRKERNEKS